MAEQPCYFFYGKSLVEVELTAGAPAVPELEPPPMATSTFALMVLTLFPERNEYSPSIAKKRYSLLALWQSSQASLTAQ